MSYLAWPVSINGRITDLNGERLHMTCKFFGATDFHVSTITEALARIDTRVLNSGDAPQWIATDDFGNGLHVLELLNPPERLIDAHMSFEGIRKDDFDPWRPHITLTKPFWEFVKADPGHTFIELGSLELMGLT